MNKILIMTVILTLAITGMTAEMLFDIQTEEPIITNYRFDNLLPKMMNPGEPMLAYQTLQILLPQGKIVSGAEVIIERDNSDYVSYIDYAQEPIPMSRANDPSIPVTPVSEEVYNTNAYYPYRDFEILGVSRKNGYDILSVNVYPYLYNPVSQHLKWASEFTLKINLEYDAETEYRQNLFLIDNTRMREEISNMVMNPETLVQYRKEHFRNEPILPDPNAPFRMIIISSKEKLEVFDEFIQWKFSHGIATGFFTTEDIYDAYEGVDEPDKIRNFIIDAYQTYSSTHTPLEYVILGGDDNIIPIRGMFGRVGNYVDYNMPSDLYYSNLDGDWDANGNGIYGEPDDDVDWYAEVALGRIPAFTDTQFRRFFNKTYNYVDNTSYSNDIAYMLGENLDRTPTWGGDYKDEIIPYLPDGYRVDTLYERDDTFSSQAVVDALHGGLGIINHIGHANYNIVFGLNNSRISRLTNSEFGFAYTQGCYPAAFDHATSEESGSVGQNLAIARGGLFAFIGNTRYGWYRRGTTDGPSQAFDKTFFSGLFEHDIRELGHTMNYSKEALVNQARTQTVMRWIYYQLVLFGDPSVEVKLPLGTFPYVEPVDVVFDDFEGDNDGVVNPGETIRIYVEIANLEDWANAEQTIGKIYLDNDYIEVLNDSSEFGFIPTNDSATNTNEPFIIRLDENTPYQTYNIHLRLDAYGYDDAHFSRVYSIPMPVTLVQKHWPKQFDKPITANPVVYDINQDGSMQIIVADIQANISVLNYDATPFGDTLSNNENLWKSTAYADITGNGVLDIIVNSRREKITAYTLEGDTLFTYNDCSQIVLTPLVADFNNDGRYQVAALDIDEWLHLINDQGEIEPGFPIPLQQTAVADLAAADITQDGYPEIIAGTLDGKLHAIKYNGNYVPNFPIELGDQIIAAPIVLHNYDIVTANREKLFLISKEGEILMEKETPGRVSMEVIAADFTGSNSLEFAYVTNNGRVDIIDRNGDSLPGFPFNTGRSFLYPPLAADINGDGKINLICYTTNGTVYGFNADGSFIDSLPFPLNTAINAPATLADIDNDGDLELVLATTFGINVVDYKYQHGEQQPWMTYRVNLQRTGFYGEDETLSADDVISPVLTNLRQNYPNPFNPTTRIDFSVGHDTHAKLQVFNIRGQLVATLVEGVVEQGHHSVHWNGVNDDLQKVGSGIYFYRLQAEETILHRKMMLIK